MKKVLFCISFLFATFLSTAQELEAPKSIYIGNKEIVPSLSFLTPDFPESKFTLREVNFNKVEKREVYFVAVMERDRYVKENSYITLDAPMPTISNAEKTLIEVTNDFRMHDRSSNFDIYTGKKKIPAYEEMRVPLFSRPYHRGSGIRGYIYPNSY